VSDEWASFRQPADQQRQDWTPPPRAPGPPDEETIREMRRALAAPYYADPAAVAAWVGCSLSFVSQVKHRRVWKHVDPQGVEAAWQATPSPSRAAELRLGSFSSRRGQKARTAAAASAWALINKKDGGGV